MTTINETENETSLPLISSSGNELPNGDAPIQSHVTQDLSNAAAVSANAHVLDKVDIQSGTAQLSGHPEAGLSSVAQFLPTDAKLDHPTPSPEQPLASGAADITADAQVDTTMADVDHSIAMMQSHAEPAVRQSGAALRDGNDAAAQPAEAESQPPSGVDGSSTSAPLPDLSTSLDPPAAPALANEPDVPAPSVETPSDTPLDTKLSELAEDRPMLDVAPTGLTRSREEDETSDEPSAKRAKVATPSIDDAQFKRPRDPETSAVPTAPAAPATSEVTVPASGPAPAPTPALSSAVPATVNGASSHLPGRAVYSKEPMTPAQKKILEEKIKNTKKVKSANLFLNPVDPIALNIPHYPNIIKNPMDLGTMERKLKSDQYDSLEAFVSDFELMVNNCFTFNGPAHAISGLAQNLRAYFLKQMDTVPTGDAAARLMQKPTKKASPAPKPLPRRESRVSVSTPKSPGPPADTFALLPGGTPMIRRDSTAGRPKRAVVPPAPRDLPYSGTKPKRKENQVGLKFCAHVLSELRKARYNGMTAFFLEPVDPVALNIPNYFSVIKTPMDLQTMTNKLKNGQYSTAEEFKADFDLMLNNCFKFNPKGNIVHDTGRTLQGEFEVLWQERHDWVKRNQPSSQRVSPASDASDDDDDDDDDDDAGDDEKSETIAQLKEQLAMMNNMLSTLTGPGAKRASPKAASKKKSRTSGGGSKTKKASAAPPAKATSKAKSKKQRLVSYEEKQEISNATEQMSAGQIEKLTQIITENVAKYKDMAGDDVELEIDDLPNEVQHKLLKYVRTIFPRARASTEEALNVDDDYEPERGGKSGSARKKHKPMKKHEQESRIAQLKGAMEQMKGSMAEAGADPDTLPTATKREESSDEDDSESSEEE